MNRFDLPRLWLRLHGRRWTVVAATVALVATTLAGTGALLYAHPFAGGTNTDRVSLHGHTVPALAHAKPLRATDGAAALDLDVVLAPRDQAGLDALIAAQNDKHSPLYQHYLTPQQYLDRFGPTQATVDAVQAFLRGQGLLVGDVSPNRLIIHASGSVATVEQAFGVQLNDYQLGGRVVHAPAGDPAVPASLGASIAGIVGLDDVVQLQPHLLRPSGKAPNAVPHAGPGGGYSPTDLRTAYDMNPLESAGIDGTGVTVALFELDGYDPNDIATFLSYYGLGTAKYSNVLVDGATNNSPGAGASEVELDMETVSAIAPGANQKVYIGPNTDQGVLDTYNQIVTDNAAKVVSTSWGLCELDAGSSFANAEDAIFRQGASQGQVFFAAAGDSGAYDCYHDSGSPYYHQKTLAVDNPADDPFVVGVGGTKLTINGDSTYNSETTWDWWTEYGSQYCSSNQSPCMYGGGGGYSTFFSRPNYQNGNGLTNAKREVPDVSADADPDTGYSVYCTAGGSSGCNTCDASGCTPWGWTYIGGTSAAAPLWAGIAALLDQYLPTKGVSDLSAGSASATFYTLYNTPQLYPAYHDITVGKNIYYSAASGYDVASGMGTPDVWNIARDLTTPALVTSSAFVNAVTAAPGTSPASQTLNIANPGNGPLHWTQTATLPSWLTLSATSGTIAALHSATLTLTFSLPSSTSAQTYSTTLTFSDPNAVPSSVSVSVTAVAANVSTQWYFAEGYTGSVGGAFDTKIALANPNPTQTTVTITYHLSAAPWTVTHDSIVMAPYARFTDDVNQYLTAHANNNNSGAGYGVATEVHATQPIVAERPMYFTYSRNGQATQTGFDVMGATSLSSQFAFDDLDAHADHLTLLTILNPTDAAMYANLTLYPADGASAPLTVQQYVAPNARGAIDVGKSVAAAHRPAGYYSGVVVLTSDQGAATPVNGLVERPMYWTNPQTGYRQGECVVGAAAGQREWDFAEGWTSAGAANQGTFNETLYLAYPAASSNPTANVTITVYKENDPSGPLVQTQQLPAGRLTTVNINALLPGFAKGNSIKVTSDQPILAERLMTWNYGATDVMGAQQTANAAYFAESYTGPDKGGFTEILTLENPNPTPAQLTITYLPANDANPSQVPPPVTMTWTIPANARSGFQVNPYMPNQGFSVVLVSSQPILAERVMYFQWGGTDAAGYQGEP